MTGDYYCDVDFSVICLLIKFQLITLLFHWCDDVEEGLDCNEYK